MGAPHDIPWKTVSTDVGDVPFYVIEFDKDGRCTSPEALEDLLQVAAGKSDVFLLSHGWNNDWDAATSRYERFETHFHAVRATRWNPPDRRFEPVLVGVFWPSAVLVAPWEAAPEIAAGGLPADHEVSVLGESLDAGGRAELNEIARIPNPTKDDVTRLAALLAPVLSDGADEFGAQLAPVDPDELTEVWRSTEVSGWSTAKPAGGFIEGGEVGGGAPQEAGWNPLQWIRDGIRVTTVLLMKDRAGRVGGRGVADMLRRLVDVTADDARICLIGHSYGCKVVLSALCNGDAPGRRVHSVLLLEPALSCYAFTADLDGRAGGYRTALERVELPIISTYSAHDVPLTRFFHLAVRRKSDLAEAVIAGQPPSKFAALGGYGPQGIDARWITMPALGDEYPLTTDERVIAVDGTTYIVSHGAVETPESAWALLSQVRS